MHRSQRAMITIFPSPVSKLSRKLRVFASWHCSQERVDRWAMDQAEQLPLHDPSSSRALCSHQVQSSLSCTIPPLPPALCSHQVQSSFPFTNTPLARSHQVQSSFPFTIPPLPPLARSLLSSGAEQLPFYHPFPPALRPLSALIRCIARVPFVTLALGALFTSTL